jgi:hypothetical protein
MNYRKLIQFSLPLAVVVVANDMGQQVLNGGMARMPDAIATLAAYGVALGIKGLLGTPLTQAAQLGLALTEDHRARRQNQRFLLGLATLVALVLAILGLTPVGVWLTKDVHSLTRQLSTEVQFALLCMVPLVFFDALSRYYAGLLLRYRQTAWTGAATLAKIGASIVTVFALLPFDLVQARPIWLPVLVIYAGALAEIVVVFSGYFKTVRGRLPPQSDHHLTLSNIVHFFWPLVFVNVVQSGSRPIINLFVARGPNAEFALAVFVIVESMAGMICGWIPELRYLPAAFRDEADSVRYIKRFTAWCGLLGIVLMAVVCWTPLLEIILIGLIGLDKAVAAASRTPLLIYSFLPLITTPRSYLHGLAVVQHRTRALVPSTPSRLAMSLVALLALPFWGVEGATLAAAAVSSGLAVETLVSWWCLRR